jgi:hypothetical protein
MNKKHLLLPGLVCVLALAFVMLRRERNAIGIPDTPPPPAGTVALRPSTSLPPPSPRKAGKAGPPAATPAVREHAPPEPVRDGDPLLAAFRPQMRFNERVRQASLLPASRQVSDARHLLGSDSAEDRALGGVLLFLNGQLTGRDLASVVQDDRLLVPLTVFDWVRDFGADGEIAFFAESLGERDISTEELAAFLADSASAPGGGRSALDLLLPRFDEESLAPELAEIIAAPGVAPDVLEQAVFKLVEPENRVFALDVLQAAAGRAGEGYLLAENICKWIDMARLAASEDGEVDYKVWDTPLRDITFLADSDAGLAVRTMANYLEYGIRRDDPAFEPVVEEGSWETAREFLEYAVSVRDELLPEERDALERLAANLDRLKAYDPAFAPDTDEDAPPSPYADDEEVDAEILDEEDSALADKLFAEDDSEPEEPEEDGLDEDLELLWESDDLSGPEDDWDDENADFPVEDDEEDLEEDESGEDDEDG